MRCYKPFPLTKDLVPRFKRKLGTKEIWVFFLHIFLPLPSGFVFGMVTPLYLQKLDTPRSLIEELGEYTVDETAEGTLKSTHFMTREDAIRYLESAPKDSTFRQTTLEDVFVDVAGRKLK